MRNGGIWIRRLSARGTMATVCLGFFAFGLVVGTLGPALPDLAERTGSRLDVLGSLFSALFFGSLLSQVVVGPLNDRVGPKPVLLAGFALLVPAIVGVSVSGTLALTLACTVVAGLGFGAVDVSSYIVVARIANGGTAVPLNLLNVFFGLGAVAGPALAGLTLRWWDTALPALWLGAALFLLALPLVPFLGGSRPPVRPEHAAAPSGRAIFRSPALWALGGISLVYVGIETGVGGWSPTYLERTTSLAESTAALITSGFWLALTAGRAAAVLVGRRLSPETLLTLSAAGSILGGALFVGTTGSVVGSTAAVLLIGFCLGPVFPTLIAIATTTFHQAPGTAASGIVALGSVGGTVLPWIQGVLLEQSGPPASAYFVALGTVALLGLQLAYRLRIVATPTAYPSIRRRHGTPESSRAQRGADPSPDRG